MKKEKVTFITPSDGWNLISPEEKSKYSKAYAMMRPRQANSCVICEKPFRFVVNNNDSKRHSWLLPSNLSYYEACTCSNECWEYLKLLMC